MNEPRVFLRPVGNPAPLGFFALAIGTLTLATMQLGWIPSGESKDVALVLIGLVFPLQMLATVFALLARDGAAAEGLGLSGGGWLVIGLVTLTSPPGSISNALGVFLLTLGACMLVSSVASASSKTVAAVIIAGIGLRFATTGVYELSADAAWETIAGICGLGLFVLAFYGGLAMTLDDARQGEAPLPIGRGSGGKPIESDPTEGVDREPGVRPKL